MADTVCTVCLLAYNQERYIRKCMDSLIAQQTDFPYVILAHDDASTDATPEILKEYAERYPEKVKLILQPENTYSKYPRVWATQVWPKVESPYIALCEGDDYWTDPNKLRTQVGFLREHPEYSLSVTNAETVDAAGAPLGAIEPYQEDTDMPVEDLIAGGGGYIATASIVTRTEYVRELPDFYYLSTVGDSPLQLYLAAKGKTRWHAAKTCAYRINADGSWTVQQLIGDQKKPIRYHESMVDMLEGFDTYTQNKYTETLRAAIDRQLFEIARLKSDFKTMRQPRFACFYEKLSLKAIILAWCLNKCPKLILAYRKLRFRTNKKSGK